jgi:hypothetical protein
MAKEHLLRGPRRMTWLPQMPVIPSAIFSEDVDVAVVPGGLLNQVEQDPPLVSP